MLFQCSRSFPSSVVANMMPSRQACAEWGAVRSWRAKLAGRPHQGPDAFLFEFISLFWQYGRPGPQTSSTRGCLQVLFGLQLPLSLVIWRHDWGRCKLESNNSWNYSCLSLSSSTEYLFHFLNSKLIPLCSRPPLFSPKHPFAELLTQSIDPSYLL